MKFVVTGNMGCGKSTVVQMIREMLPDHQLFDFDKMVHGLYEDPNVQLSLLVNVGATDRKTISTMAFADPSVMTKVEKIMNGLIILRVAEAFREENIIIDMPLYFEYFAQTFAAPVVCVTCRPEIQRDRIRSRNGFSDEKIDQILAKQLSQQEKASRSNVVIDNSGTVDDLRKQVVAFVQKGFKDELCDDEE